MSDFRERLEAEQRMCGRSAQSGVERLFALLGELADRVEVLEARERQESGK
jgi:hypothetical protein